MTLGRANRRNSGVGNLPRRDEHHAMQFTHANHISSFFRRALVIDFCFFPSRKFVRFFVGPFLLRLPRCKCVDVVLVGSEVVWDGHVVVNCVEYNRKGFIERFQSGVSRRSDARVNPPLALGSSLYGRYDSGGSAVGH